MWPTSRLLTDVSSYAGANALEINTQRLIASSDCQQSDLGHRMITNGTWPESIVVIRNDVELIRPDGLALAKPYHLMEGHHRLGYLKALVEHPEWEPAPEHGVWTVRVPPSAVVDYWPLNEAPDA